VIALALVRLCEVKGSQKSSTLAVRSPLRSYTTSPFGISKPITNSSLHKGIT
jgi:hypothetical protein